MNEQEREGQMEWLTDLKEMLLDGRVDLALAAIKAAIKMLEREQNA